MAEQVPINTEGGAQTYVRLVKPAIPDGRVPVRALLCSAKDLEPQHIRNTGRSLEHVNHSHHQVFSRQQT